MKRALTLYILALSLFASTASAQTDNLGRPLIDEAALGVASVEGVQPQMFDLSITLAAGGANDSTSTSEVVIASLALLWYPPTESGWVKFGPQIGWNQSDRTRLDLSVPVYFTLFPDPMSGARWFLTANPFTFTVRTEPMEGTVSPWSFDPGASFGVEFPMDNYALALRVGANYVFSAEGVRTDDVQGVSVGAGATVFFRLGR